MIMKLVGHTTLATVSRYNLLAPDSVKGAPDCLAQKSGTPVVQGTGTKRKGL